MFRHTWAYEGRKAAGGTSHRIRLYLLFKQRDKQHTSLLPPQVANLKPFVLRISDISKAIERGNLNKIKSSDKLFCFLLRIKKLQFAPQGSGLL